MGMFVSAEICVTVVDHVLYFGMLKIYDKYPYEQENLLQPVEGPAEKLDAFLLNIRQTGATSAVLPESCSTVE